MIPEMHTFPVKVMTVDETGEQRMPQVGDILVRPFESGWGVFRIWEVREQEMLCELLPKNAPEETVN